MIVLVLLRGALFVLGLMLLLTGCASRDDSAQWGAISRCVGTQGCGYR